MILKHRETYLTRDLPPNPLFTSSDSPDSLYTNLIRFVHATTKNKAATTVAKPIIHEKEEVKAQDNTFLNRFTTTAEVTVSKIFPAGFGWQSASILADNMGLDSTSLEFAAATGGGDAVGVMVGHTSYYALKKAAGWDVNMKEVTQTGVLLSTAAFCSGSVWQPIVNTLQGMDQSFLTVFGGTWIGCASAFYVGLRAGRVMLSNLEHIESPNSENSVADVQLSASIGGATAFFVGTDATYLPTENFLLPIVGIVDGTPDLTGCAIAGCSTGLGFLASQNIQNAIVKKGGNWTD